MNEIRVLLVDDHVQLRSAVRRLIESQPDMQLVAEAGSVREAVHLVQDEALTVVVMDLSLPDGDGIVATAEILQRRPDLRVLGLSRHEDPGHVARMRAAGASGYVLKRNAGVGLLTAIRTVAAGRTYIDPAFASKPREPQSFHTSTAAQVAVRAPAATESELCQDEVAVLQRVAGSHSNREIAEELGMPITAVIEHKAQAMAKLGLNTRIDVVRYVESRGWKRETS